MDRTGLPPSMLRSARAAQGEAGGKLPVSEIRESNSVVTLVEGGLSLCRKHLCHGRINWHKTAEFPNSRPMYQSALAWL